MVDGGAQGRGCCDAAGAGRAGIRSGVTSGAEPAQAIAVIVTAAGDLILLTRDIIRGIIGNLFADVVIWALDSQTVARAVLAVRLNIVVATTWRIHAYLTACTDSITTLSLIIDG